jgi:hypothetical protein
MLADDHALFRAGFDAARTHGGVEVGRIANVARPCASFRSFDLTVS